LEGHLHLLVATTLTRCSFDELIATVRRELKPGVTVLIKGSRVNRLERVAAALATSADSTGGAH